LKAEEGDAGAVVCLIDTEGAKPEGSDKSEGSTAEVAPAAPVAEAPKELHQSDSSSSYPAATYASGTPSSCKKILDEKYSNYLG
jgi:2-oxoglutarate dehydrogenase E2 component (dihydrolipoamide succinyltransferase)